MRVFIGHMFRLSGPSKWKMTVVFMVVMIEVIGF
jgi:hypothetical protein